MNGGASGVGKGTERERERERVQIKEKKKEKGGVNCGRCESVAPTCFKLCSHFSGPVKLWIWFSRLLPPQTVRFLGLAAGGRGVFVLLVRLSIYLSIPFLTSFSTVLVLCLY